MDKSRAATGVMSMRANAKCAVVVGATEAAVVAVVVAVVLAVAHRDRLQRPVTGIVVVALVVVDTFTMDKAIWNDTAIPMPCSVLRPIISMEPRFTEPPPFRQPLVEVHGCPKVVGNVSR